MNIIAGDIGGTKTLLQILEVEGHARRVLHERRYESDAYPSFEALLREFLDAAKATVEYACFAVAGPLIDDDAHLTNLRWIIRRSTLESSFNIPHVVLVNDFFAVAAGIPLLRADDVVELNAGVRAPHEPVAVLGAGTGLGEALILPCGDEWEVLASEGGHCDFAPRGPLQCELLTVLERRYGHVSYERLVSGQGLVNIFTFLRDRLGVHLEGPIDDDDFPAMIATLADEGNPIARETFEIFIDIYGAEAGNLALKGLTRGGVYLAGGIGAKNLHRFTDGRFVEAFTRKGRFRDFMLSIPVNLIINPKVGLMGAAEIAAQRARTRGRPPSI
ncbi:MAG TPA: glucokinase [Thermoanaerobaculia bacterium]